MCSSQAATVTTLSMFRTSWLCSLTLKPNFTNLLLPQQRFPEKKPGLCINTVMHLSSSHTPHLGQRTASLQPPLSNKQQGLTKSDVTRVANTAVHNITPGGNACDNLEHLCYSQWLPAIYSAGTSSLRKSRSTTLTLLLKGWCQDASSYIQKSETNTGFWRTMVILRNHEGDLLAWGLLQSQAWPAAMVFSDAKSRQPEFAMEDAEEGTWRMWKKEMLKIGFFHLFLLSAKKINK